MDKEQFIKLMSEIIKYNKKLDELYKSVDDLFGGCDTLMYKTSMDGIIKVISEIVGDKDEWIFWYMYDNNYGMGDDAVFIDGKYISVKLIEDLWEVIQKLKGE